MLVNLTISLRIGFHIIIGTMIFRPIQIELIHYYDLNSMTRYTLRILKEYIIYLPVFYFNFEMENVIERACVNRLMNIQKSLTVKHRWKFGNCICELNHLVNLHRIPYKRSVVQCLNVYYYLLLAR